MVMEWGFVYCSHYEFNIWGVISHLFIWPKLISSSTVWFGRTAETHGSYSQNQGVGFKLFLKPVLG